MNNEVLELTEDEIKLQILYLKNKYLLDDFEFEKILKKITRDDR